MRTHGRSRERDAEVRGAPPRTEAAPARQVTGAAALVQLQRQAGNRVVSALASDRPPVQRLFGFKKKKKPVISGPTNVRKMTFGEQKGVLSNAQLLVQYQRQKERKDAPGPFTDEVAEGVGHMIDEADLEASREPKRRMALEKGTGPGISDEAAEGVGQLFIRLEDVMTAFLGKPPLVPAELKEACESASQTERDEVYADKKLMARLEKGLPVRQYISLLGWLRVVEQPTTGSLAEGNGAKGGHTSAETADRIIQEKMQAYVVEAVKAGKKVAGQVAIVSDADFRKAYLDEYGPKDLDVDKTNAFVRTKGNDGLIVIHQDRGNAGTTIHEGMHKYSEPTLQSHVGFNFNEGVTEVLTREITSKLPTPIARGNYQNQYLIVTKLVTRVGLDTLSKAYFHGKYAELVSAWKKSTGKSTQAWNAMVANFRADKFQDAYDAI